MIEARPSAKEDATSSHGEKNRQFGFRYPKCSYIRCFVLLGILIPKNSQQDQLV